MKTEFKNYPIYKKRDGQHFKEVSSIYATSFEEAKKEFSLNMTKENWEKSNDIIWLDKEIDGVDATGWYDFGGGRPTFNEETEKYDADEVENYLLVSEESINEGFETWYEDVYTWELREPLDYVEIENFDEFECYKDDYKRFMVFEGERYFLYNGDFTKIAEAEYLGTYSEKDDNFIGCSLDDEDFINSHLN